MALAAAIGGEGDAGLDKGGWQVSTQVIQDSLAPDWKEVFRLPFTSNGDTYEALLDDESYPGFGAIHLRLMDWNRLSHSQEIGHTVISRRLVHKVCLRTHRDCLDARLRAGPPTLPPRVTSRTCVSLASDVSAVGRARVPGG